MSDSIRGSRDSVAPVARPEKMRLMKWPRKEVLVPAVRLEIRATTTASRNTGRRPRTNERGRRARHPIPHQVNVPEDFDKPL
jgi:hypothetical protein